jgi:hypothetical protein
MFKTTFIYHIADYKQLGTRPKYKTVSFVSEINYGLVLISAKPGMRNGGYNAFLRHDNTKAMKHIQRSTTLLWNCSTNEVCDGAQQTQSAQLAVSNGERNSCYTLHNNAVLIYTKLRNWKPD